jgi:hypothetical protein
MPKADMQRRHFELTAGATRLLVSPPMHARSSHMSGRSPARFHDNNTTREAA